jgi:ABC-2 type transport system ATP-binding protein
MGTPAQLKTDCMPEEVLEIACAASHEVLDDLERLPAVKEVALFGNALHLVARDGAEAARQAKARLAELGRAEARIETITPSLEDVFVSLIEAHDRAQSPQQEVLR